MRFRNSGCNIGPKTVYTVILLDACFFLSKIYGVTSFLHLLIDIYVSIRKFRLEELFSLLE